MGSALVTIMWPATLRLEPASLSTSTTAVSIKYRGAEGGGTISQDVLVSLTAANVTIGDVFTGLITNMDGGQIGGSAELAAILAATSTS